MALLCRDIVRRALRKLSLVAGGKEPSGNEANDAIETLRAIYLEMVGSGVFGQFKDVVVTDTAYTAREQDRILCKRDEGVTVTLPELVICDSRSGSRAPKDRAGVMVTDLYSDVSQTWIYDAQVGRWSKLEELGLNDVAPLAARHSEALACILACRIAPEYAIEASQQVAVGAVRGLYAITHHYDTPSEPVRAVFM